jgi:hypothetical protein
MSTKVPALPGHFGELVRRGFGGAAIRLIMEWGGTKRFIPRDPRPDSPIVQIIGMAASRVLGELIGSTHYDIPSKKWLRGDALKQEILREDGTTREVAVKLGCTERHVRGVRRDGGKKHQPRRPVDNSQFGMFD